MKSKKIVMGLCALGMAISLSGCGSKQETTDGLEGTQVKTEELNVQEVMQTQEESEKELQKPFSEAGTIEETVLVEENDVKIIATDLSYTTYSTDLNLIIENNSEKDLTFVSGSIGYNCNAVNGYMMDGGYLNVDVAAGKKANEKISFSMDELAIYGLNEVADIQVGFDIMDTDFNHWYSEPKQIKTSVADTYDYETDTYKKAITSNGLSSAYGYTVDYYAEDELYNQNGISIISETLVTNKDGEKAIFLEVENNSEEYINGAVTDVAINGLQVYSGLWLNNAVNSGTRRVMKLTLSTLLDKAYGDALGINEVGELSFEFGVKDLNYDEVIAPEGIVITIPEVKVSFDASGEEVYNENNIRIISKGLVKDSLEYSEDIHMLLLVENNYSETIKVDEALNSLSLNGLMTDCISPNIDIPMGKSGIIDITIPSFSLENNNITGIEEVKEAEITFEIRDMKYKDIAEAKVQITY